MVKKKMYIVLALVVFAFVVSFPVHGELVSEWKFDGNGRDSKGTNHGTLHGKPVYTADRFGKLGKALKFDGIDDYVDCGNDKSLNITDSITISAWIKVDALGAVMEIVCKNKYSQYHMLIWKDHADLAMHITGAEINSFAGHPVVEVEPKTEIKTGEWYYFVGVYDGSFLRLYVDGKEVGKDPATGSIATSEENLYIGGYLGSLCKDPIYYDHDLLFDGAIDDVRIYNHALTAPEIKKFYDETKPSEKRKKDLSTGLSQNKEKVIFSDNFESRSKSNSIWKSIIGTWKVKDGLYYQEDNSPGIYNQTLSNTEITEGTIEVTATALEATKYAKGGCFGIILKYIDKDNWCALRYGDYGSVIRIAFINGEIIPNISITQFTPVLKKKYKLKVTIKDDKVAAFLDDALLGIVEIPFVGKKGRVGFWAGSKACFDDFKVTGFVKSVKKEKFIVSGTPELSLEFAAWRSLTGLEKVSLGGSLYFYLKNSGDGPAIIKDTIKINNKEITELQDKGIVSWYRMRPEILPPGETGELLVCFKKLPQENIDSFMENFESFGSLSVEVKPEAGKALKSEVKISSYPPSIQINFIGFNQPLNKLYLYLQNNKKKTTYHLTRIFLNGKEVTEGAIFGERELKDTVIPVEVSLKKPLSKGEAAVVTVNTEEGASAGLALRAFPSEFPVQITLLGNQLREDCVEDIANHCANSIGRCWGSDKYFLKAKPFGLKLLHFGRWSKKYLSPEYPEVIGLWRDEVATTGNQTASSLFFDLEKEQRRRKKVNYPVMSTFSLLNLWRDSEFLEMPDAVTNIYGFSWVKRNFKNNSDFLQNEYRLSRRPSWPYMRNAEYALIVDPDSDKIIKKASATKRCIEPEEQRYIIYRCLMQGAKGVLYWNYGAHKYLDSREGFFDKSKKATILRLSMGGIPPGTDIVHGYKIPANIIDDLNKIWKEIGRINAELRIIGSLVAISDVCNNLVTIKNAKPSISINKGPTAYATSLLCGKDTMILLVLNNNIQSTWHGGKEQKGVSSYEPVDVSVDLKIPSWLKPKDVFSVDYQGLKRLKPNKNKGIMQFQFDKLAATKVVVITKDRNLYSKLEKISKEMKEKLNRGN